MDSTRQNKFARLIQKEMGTLLQKEGNNYYGNILVSVTTVKVSPDLGYIKCYVSIMGSQNREGVVSILNTNHKDIRRLLGMQIKNQIRHIPEISFYLDDSFDHAAKMEELFKDIDKPGVLPEKKKRA
jgi:ribosome-binding factor A